MKFVSLALAALAAAAVVATSAMGSATVTTLKAKTGPGFTISLRTKSGKLVKTLKAGKYRIRVADKSSIHNFHLKGAGVDKKTSVPFVGTKTWTVRFKKGKTYKYVCDIHRTTMHGKFRVK